MNSTQYFFIGLATGSILSLFIQTACYRMHIAREAKVREVRELVRRIRERSEQESNSANRQQAEEQPSV